MHQSDTLIDNIFTDKLLLCNVYRWNSALKTVNSLRSKLVIILADLNMMRLYPLENKFHVL